MAVIRVENLRKRFNLEAGFFARFGRFVYAVNGVSFSIGENETYGLVGESGCGKTTTARLLVRMYESDAGSILYQDGIDVGSLKGAALRKYREKVKYVFQDPARSLNPRMTVYDVLTSGCRWSSAWPGKKAARKEAAAILEETGLGAADLERRPSEFSGGQRQRISIARGLLMKPELLICDEVVSALDVSIQGQILNLLLDIRSRRSLSFLFIAHDLKAASYFCDRIGVMYRGELMEEAPAAELYLHARHPYTRLLFSSAPRPSGAESGPPQAEERREIPSEAGLPTEALSGEAGTPAEEIGGCAFAGRCPITGDRCLREKPPRVEAGAGHVFYCWKA
ncbi:MAG: ABC transporter ATP-binding protein [Treponema sp.]|jgi:oligopeptide/dipeptide ABC transporter ATP-binding protein|nr:ABC transporter ATP-binding protein [Treponema sp.]